MISLRKLKIGERATVVEFVEGEFALKMMEMGVVPGKIVRLVRKAPSGNPIVIESGMSLIAVRLEESDGMFLKLI
jgi:ferrous iron transport protein A